jgi:hypothetical protein
VNVDRAGLLAQEAESWVELLDVVDGIDSERLEEPGVTPDGWSVKDVLVHVGGWLEECGVVLEAMQAGTWERTRSAEPPGHVERVNAGHVELARSMDVVRARSFLEAARDRARSAMSGLGSPSVEAWAWFEESGPMHYAKHRHDLIAWLAGVPSDPRVGRLLQADAEDWVGFASVLDALDPATLLGDPLGWTVHDVAFHVAMWVETAAADVGSNRGWAHDDDPGEADLVDAMNARWLVEGRGLAPDEVRARLGGARARLRAAVAALPAPSDDALAWFEANSVEHYAEHLPHLRAVLPGRAGEHG